MSDAAPRPLWQTVLLAIAPGLASAALGALHSFVARARSSDDLTGPIEFAMLLSPFVGGIYLIVLARRSVRGGDDRLFQLMLFVGGYGFVNLLLWGAGCAAVLDSMNFH